MYTVFENMVANANINLGLTVFRFCTAFIAVREVYRILWLILFFSATLSRFVFKFSRQIERLWNPGLFIDIYTQLLITYSIVTEITELALLGTMAAGLVIGIGVNFTVLKLYNHISLLLYINIAMLTVSLPVLMNSTLPLAAEAYEKTSKLLKVNYLRYKIFRKTNPILMRRIAALRPVTVCAGLLNYRLFKLQKSTLTIYYKNYVDYTIVVLMYVHV